MQLPNVSILFLISTLLSFAEGNGLDPVKNFCKRWYHQSQVKNGMLFIDGGLETFVDQGVNPVMCGTSNNPNWTGPITVGPGQSIVAVNMSASWNWKCNISEVVIAKTPPASTGNPVPEVQNAALFYGPPGDTQVYLYGGVTPSINTSFPNYQGETTNQYTLWGFDTGSYDWTQYDVLKDVPQRPSWGSYADAPDLGLGFYLNGIITNYSSYSTQVLGNTVVPLEGLVIVDLNNQTARNITTQTDILPGLRGGMVYIPAFGEQGILVTIAGASCTLGACNDTELVLAKTTEVQIFDVASANTSTPSWSTQSTSGTAPEPRVDFCLVIVSAPDNSSHNIYLYGGWDPNTGTSYDDIWVLTIPTFTWINTYKGTAPRFGHTCHVVGNDQMLTVGGLDYPNITDNCDWEYMSVAIYNLTADNVNGWGSVFTANSRPYGVSQPIYSVIGGGSSGNATKLLPNSGWSNTQVASLFSGTTNLSAPANITSISSSNSTSSSPSSSSKSNGLSGGAIAGIVIGSVAALSLLLLGLYLRHRSKQKKKAAEIAAKREKERLEQEERARYEKAELGNTESKGLKVGEGGPGGIGVLEAGEEREMHEMFGSQVGAEADSVPRAEAWAGELPQEMEGSIPPSRRETGGIQKPKGSREADEGDAEGGVGDGEGGRREER